MSSDSPGSSTQNALRSYSAKRKKDRVGFRAQWRKKEKTGRSLVFIIIIFLTCRLLWHMGLWGAVRWLCTHFPKCCRQVESDGAQVWEHDGRFSSRQLEQDVCWQEPWHSLFCRDVDLQTRKFWLLLKKQQKQRGIKRMERGLTWQSRLQRGWPGSTPWCTLVGSSLHPAVQSLNRFKEITNESPALWSQTLKKDRKTLKGLISYW